MASEDPFIAELLEVANLDGSIAVAGGWAARNEAETGLSHHPDPDDFGRYGAAGRDFVDGSGDFVDGTGRHEPVRTYLSDCPSFAPLDLGLWL